MTKSFETIESNSLARVQGGKVGLVSAAERRSIAADVRASKMGGRWTSGWDGEFVWSPGG